MRGSIKPLPEQSCFGDMEGPRAASLGLFDFQATDDWSGYVLPWLPAGF